MSTGRQAEQELLARLAGFDTPSICNAIEDVCGGRRDTGFTRRTLISSRPDRKPVAGRARTATLRSTCRAEAGGDIDRRLEYYRYATQPGAVVVIEDLDRPAGLGCFWGEVQSAIHASLGVAGVVTSGAMRDLDMIDRRLPVLAGAVTPSHAFVDIEQFDGTVSIHGMTVAPGNIVHADKHGAVVIPDEVAAELPAALEAMVRREGIVLSAAAQPGFGIDQLEEALRAERDSR